MYIRGDKNRDIPGQIYRSTAEIREDIQRVKEKINEISERVNIRALLVDIISEARDLRPGRMLSELRVALEEAEEALASLKGFEEELLALEAELKVTIWEMGA